MEETVSALLGAIVGGLATYIGQWLLDKSRRYREKREWLNQNVYAPLYYDVQDRVERMAKLERSLPTENLNTIRAKGHLRLLPPKLTADIEEFFFNKTAAYNRLGLRIYDAIYRLVDKYVDKEDYDRPDMHARAEEIVNFWYGKKKLAAKYAEHYLNVEEIVSNRCRENFRCTTPEFIAELEKDSEFNLACSEVSQIIVGGESLLRKLDIELKRVAD